MKKSLLQEFCKKRGTDVALKQGRKKLQKLYSNITEIIF
jgi:hypothetical protein